MSRIITRRELLAGTAALAVPALEASAAGASTMPGPYRGRVIEVSHPGSVVDHKVQRAAVKSMMERGMRELTGEKEEAAAWKRFFGAGDVVLIKVCPVGAPKSISQPETILETIRCLNLAGVKNKDIVVYDRYQKAFLDCGYDKILPDGVRWGYAAPDYEDLQVDTTGYDLNTYVEMDRVHPMADPNNPVHRRSHLAKVIRDVNKIVNIGVLKDHASAGMTMALKNLSHGSVNNVSRSHASASINWCDRFIPTVVKMPAIRDKAVLHIGDGLIGTYDGGPGSFRPHFRAWEYKSLFFATDPVAMDRIGWQILDAKRAAEGLTPIGETGIKAKNPGHESFDHRQPEHVLLAAEMGLGEADLKKIDHRKLTL